MQKKTVFLQRMQSATELQSPLLTFEDEDMTPFAAKDSLNISQSDIKTNQCEGGLLKEAVRVNRSRNFGCIQDSVHFQLGINSNKSFVNQKSGFNYAHSNEYQKDKSLFSKGCLQSMLRFDYVPITKDEKHTNNKNSTRNKQYMLESKQGSTFDTIAQTTVSTIKTSDLFNWMDFTQDKREFAIFAPLPQK